jgi:hypothetical protein
MRIKTQNMIVLTVEFTRIPLSRRGEKPLARTSNTAYIILRRPGLLRSHRKYRVSLRETPLALRADVQ